MKRIVSAAALLASVLIGAHAEDGPVETFGADTKTAVYLCTITARGVVLTLQLGEQQRIDDSRRRLSECVTTSEEKAKGLFQSAQAKTKKKPALEALKRYYAVWLSSIRSLDVRTEDSKSTYDARIASNDQKIKEAWAAVEIEQIP